MKKSSTYAFDRPELFNIKDNEDTYKQLLELENKHPNEVQLDWFDILRGEGARLNDSRADLTAERFQDLDGRCFFKDGTRKIDYIITWEEEKTIHGVADHTHTDKPDNFSTNHQDNSTNINQKFKHQQYRMKFEENLDKIGVEMELDQEESEKIIIHCIKIHIPFDLLCQYAEEMNLRAPLQVREDRCENFTGKILESFHIPNIMNSKFPKKSTSFHTCNFKRNKLDKYLGSNNHDTFFNITQRQQVAYEILATQIYGKRRKAEIGIDRMIEEGIYSAAYPLHDGPYDTSNCKDGDKMNLRQVLYDYWGKYSCWYKYQPLDLIREYYGEKIGLYFAWLGMYTVWLLPASIVGILVFLYGLMTMNQNIPSIEVCQSNKTYKMCPLCREDIGCPYWYLSDVCFYVKITYLFDHPGTVFYAIFMAFWAVSYFENWKRKNASLAYHWDVIHFEEEEQRPRPEYSALCPSLKQNPITTLMEPHFPKMKRVARFFTGIGVIFIMVVLIIIFIIAVIIYRVLIAIPFFQNPHLRSKALIFASTSAAFVNLILIMCLGRVYEKIAYKLTQWEMHRTQTEFDNHLILKVYLFQFMNFYSSIFYIAFFKGKFNGYPGNYNLFFGMRNEECSNGSCLFELAQQLAIIMVGKQIINNFQEVFVPKILGWFHRFSKGLNKVIYHDGEEEKIKYWAEDYKLLPYEGLFEEYLEMVLQFGFITIFVAAFPLAPLFALLNNWVEIRLDAQKLVCETRRPVPERSQDIGTWAVILDAIMHLSVISNAFLIAFTSEFLPKLIYKYEYDSDLKGYVNFTLSWSPKNSLSQPCRYRAFRDEMGHQTVFYWKLLALRLGFVIIFEHVVFSVSHLIDIVIPDVSNNLNIKMRRENYLAKQALLESKKNIENKTFQDCKS